MQKIMQERAQRPVQMRFLAAGVAIVARQRRFAIEARPFVEVASLQLCSFWQALASAAHGLGEKAAFDYLLQRWRETDNVELLPTLVGLAKQQSPDEINELTQAWVSAQPNSAAARLTLAEQQMSAGDEQAAIASYETALKQRPDNPIAMNNLAWLLRETDQERAVSLASQANEMAPNNAAILDTYGWILHLAGRNDEAQEALKKALALAPDNEEIQQHLDSIEQASK